MNCRHRPHGGLAVESGVVAEFRPSVRVHLAAAQPSFHGANLLCCPPNFLLLRRIRALDFVPFIHGFALPVLPVAVAHTSQQPVGLITFPVVGAIGPWLSVKGTNDNGVLGGSGAILFLLPKRGVVATDPLGIFGVLVEVDGIFGIACTFAGNTLEEPADCELVNGERGLSVSWWRGGLERWRRGRF